MKMFMLLFLPFLLFASEARFLRWGNGETYLQFLHKYHLPSKPLYYNLSNSNQQAIDEIRQGVHYQILFGAHKNVEQVLIPISDELQIHITKTKKSATFKLIPINSITKQEGFVITVKNSPYNDIIKDTHSKKLAQLFIDSFKKSINFKRDIHKGDKIVMVYDQKYRFGRPFSMPELKVAMIQTGKTNHYVFNYNGRYYNAKGHQIQGFIFIRPVKGGWISSTFSLRRWQPILHIYRPHFGVDYAVVVGTPIHAAASGRIIYAGWMRGYGNVIKIANGDGYVTLYAHQKHFKRGIKAGKYVKQGQVIGYVGVTGLSTGPHLHFGVYRYGRAINPQLVVQKATKHLRGKTKRRFLAYEHKMNIKLHYYLANNIAPTKLQPFKPVYYVNSSNIQPQHSVSYPPPVPQKHSGVKIVL